ncbi:MAG: TIGR04002 family protein [Ruminococcus sp.]|nr:TIGR04002 family protein [Ruminococcus sp.]
MASTNQKIKKLALTGLFMAMTYVLTAFFHIPTIKGYVHVGDAIVFIASCVLPTPYAIASASIGGALADALSGYWIWVPATLLIKGLTALFFTSKKEKVICRRNLLALIPALILCVGGYGLYSGFVIYDSLVAGFADAFANTMQIVTSAFLYVILGLAFDKLSLKKKMQ